VIKIVHAKRARSARIIWLLEELGVPYELETVEFTSEYLGSQTHRALHPLGQLPVVFDDGVKMIESGAIVEYLLEKHGQGRLAPPAGTPERAAYLQWFHYGEASLARFTSEIVRNRFGRTEAERVPAIADDNRVRLHQSIAFVDAELASRPYIAGSDFTAADIMVSYGMIMAKVVRELPAEVPNVTRYLERLKERPAYAKAWA
jgi:glutathione S-transferase